MDIDRKTYNKQRILCVSLIRRKRKNFLNNISSCDITNNETFWKTVKPLFTDTVQTKSKIKYSLYPLDGHSKRRTPLISVQFFLIDRILVKVS